MQNLADLRREYTLAKLDLQTVDPDPIKQFESWFREAVDAQTPEANAMTLSTLTLDGRPTSRVVLLKGVENGGFVFYTNYQSAKGRELEKNPACSLNFYWAELERQVRIEGIAERIAAAESERYFHSRPRGSQIGAWASPQSTPIEGRAILEQRFQQLETKFKDTETIPKPHQWGGYTITPLLFEFWQGRESRLHDRVKYTRVDSEWKRVCLAP